MTAMGHERIAASRADLRLRARRRRWGRGGMAGPFKNGGPRSRRVAGMFASLNAHAALVGTPIGAAVALRIQAP